MFPTLALKGDTTFSILIWRYIGPLLYKEILSLSSSAVCRTNILEKIGTEGVNAF